MVAATDQIGKETNHGVTFITERPFPGTRAKLLPFVKTIPYVQNYVKT